MTNPVEWADKIVDVKEKLGITAVILFIFLAAYFGFIPSPVSSALENIETLVRQNQIMIVDQYGYDYIQCRNKAEADSAGDPTKEIRFTRRCIEQAEQTRRHLQALGIMGWGLVKPLKEG